MTNKARLALILLIIIVLSLITYSALLITSRTNQLSNQSGASKNVVPTSNPLVSPSASLGKVLVSMYSNPILLYGRVLDEKGMAIPSVGVSYDPSTLYNSFVTVVNNPQEPDVIVSYTVNPKHGSRYLVKPDTNQDPGL